MKSYRKELWFEIPHRRGFVNITPQVQKCLEDSQVQEGLVLVNAMHITASVFINDDEPGLHHDYELWLEKLAPHEPVDQYRHNGYEDNADAHLKRQIMVKMEARQAEMAQSHESQQEFINNLAPEARQIVVQTLESFQSTLNDLEPIMTAYFEEGE